MRYERPSTAARGRRSRAKVTPHSHRKLPNYPDPYTGRTWPPRGWSEAGIRAHRVEHRRLIAFLSTWGAADITLSHCGRMSPTEARLRELAQFGRDKTSAAAQIDDATTSVLDMGSFARAETHPIQCPLLTAARAVEPRLWYRGTAS